MSDFLDGPADGLSLSFKRHPQYLRVVTSADGFDVLDQLDDDPRPDERVSVYHAWKNALGGIYVYEYRHMATVDGEKLRERGAWRAWVEQQTRERLDPTTGKPYREAAR